MVEEQFPRGTFETKYLKLSSKLFMIEDRVSYRWHLYKNLDISTYIINIDIYQQTQKILQIQSWQFYLEVDIKILYGALKQQNILQKEILLVLYQNLNIDLKV